MRLLELGEAREILRHYEDEPDFRDQVNRYIHDFEAMLRRILADRDGSPLGVTLLSSDMGKLYVALAQAIEQSASANALRRTPPDRREPVSPAMSAASAVAPPAETAVRHAHRLHRR